MDFNVHFISSRLAELSVDETKSGVLDADEAKELALILTRVASELLELEKK